MTEPARSARPAAGQIPYIELDGSPRAPTAANRADAKALTTLVPGHYAAIYRAIPLHYDGQKLTVALVNPHDATALARLQDAAGVPLQAAPLDPATFSRLYAALYQPRMPTASGARPEAKHSWWLGLAVMAAISLLGIVGWIGPNVAVPFLCATALILLISWFVRETT